MKNGKSDKRMRNTSKFISLILRHKPETIGISSVTWSGAIIPSAMLMAWITRSCWKQISWSTPVNMKKISKLSANSGRKCSKP